MIKMAAEKWIYQVYFEKFPDGYYKGKFNDAWVKTIASSKEEAMENAEGFAKKTLLERGFKKSIVDEVESFKEYEKWRGAAPKRICKFVDINNSKETFFAVRLTNDGEDIYGGLCIPLPAIERLVNQEVVPPQFIEYPRFIPEDISETYRGLINKK